MSFLIDGQYRPGYRPPAAEPPAPPRPPAGPPAPPPDPPATTTSVQQKTRAAEKAQATADKAARNSDDDRNPIGRQTYLAELRSDASAAWKEVDQEVRRLYQQPATLDETRATTTAASPWLQGSGLLAATPTQQSAIAQVRHIADTTTSLQASGATDPRFQRIVMTAQADAAAQATKDLQPETPAWGGPALLLGPPGLSAALQQARELEIVGRAAASDDPMATLDSMAPQGTSARWTPAYRAELEARVMGAADAGIEAAWRSGGVEAATDVLRQRVEAAPDAAAAAAWVARAQPLIGEAGTLLSGDARQADDNLQPAVTARYDAVTGDLAAIYEVTSQGTAGRDSPASRSVLDAVTSGIGKDIGRLDEALAHAAIDEGHAALALDTMAALQRSGSSKKAEQADQILNRSIEAFDAVAETAKAAQDDLTARQVAAQTYVAKASPLASAEGVDKALRDYWAQPDQIASQEAANQASLLALKGAATLETMANQGHGDHVDDAHERVDDFTVADSTLQAVSSNDAAQAWIAQRQFSTAGGSTGFLSADQLGRAMAGAEHPQDARDAWAGLLVQVATGQAASVKVAGDTAAAGRAVGGLQRYGEVLAPGDAGYGQAVAAMKQAALASTPEEADSALQSWASLFNTASNGPEAVKKALQPVSRGAALFSGGTAATLAIIGTGLDVANLADRPSLQAALGTGVDGAQAIVNVGVAARTLRGLSTTALETAGKWVNGAGAVLATVDALQSLGSGADAVTVGLKATGAAGSWLILAGSVGEGAWAGPVGVGIALASTAALMVYSRVEASNRYETGDATHFIALATGLPDGGGEPVAYHLRNDDSNGRNHNEVIYLAVAQHLGIAADFSDASKQQVVNWLSKLSSDEASRLADTAAHVPFQTVDAGTGADATDRNGQVYAQSADNDHWIGANAGTGYAPRGVNLMPASIDGLAAWIEHRL